MSQQLLDSEAIEEITAPDITDLVIEDDIPVDNFQSEKQRRLLVEPLYSSRILPAPFIAAANVGLFYTVKQEPIVPDAFLSLGVQMPTDWSRKENRSYFFWEFGKAPEVAIEVVSNRKGNELSSKKTDYARIGVIYYAVFDPLRQIQDATQMQGQLLKVFALAHGHYIELTDPFYLDTVGLGLAVWEGEFETQVGTWLRWCDRYGRVIPTGQERAAQAEARVSQVEARVGETEALLEQERQEKARLMERLRSLGVDPDTI